MTAPPPPPAPLPPRAALADVYAGLYGDGYGTPADIPVIGQRLRQLPGFPR
jgi:hypothetical protein